MRIWLQWPCHMFLIHYKVPVYLSHSIGNLSTLIHYNEPTHKSPSSKHRFVVGVVFFFFLKKQYFEKFPLKIILNCFLWHYSAHILYSPTMEVGIFSILYRQTNTRSKTVYVTKISWFQYFLKHNITEAETSGDLLVKELGCIKVAHLMHITLISRLVVVVFHSARYSHCPTCSLQYHEHFVWYRTLVVPAYLPTSWLVHRFITSYRNSRSLSDA